MDTLISLVDSSDISDEVKTKLKEQAEKERKTYDQRYQKKDGEALRAKNALKSVGYDHEKHATFEDFTIALNKTLSKKDEDLQGKENTLLDVTNKLTELQNKITGIENEKSEALAAAKKSTVTTELTNRLNKRLVGHEHVVKSIVLGDIEKFEVSGGNVVFNDGANSVSIDDFANTVIENNKPLQIAEQQNGSGHGAGNGGGEGSLVSGMRERAGLENK